MGFLMVFMASGIACGCVCAAVTGGVVQDGGHTPANRLTETCSLGLQHPLKLGIHVMLNY